MPTEYFFIDQTAISLDCEKHNDKRSIYSIPIFEDLNEIEYRYDKITSITCKSYQESISTILNNVAKKNKKTLMKSYVTNNIKNDRHLHVLSEREQNAYDSINVDLLISRHYYPDAFIKKVNARYLEIINDFSKHFSFQPDKHRNKCVQSDDPRVLQKYLTIGVNLAEYIPAYDRYVTEYKNSLSNEVDEDRKTSDVFWFSVLMNSDLFKVERKWTRDLIDFFRDKDIKDRIDAYLLPVLLRHSPYGDFTKESLLNDMYGQTQETNYPDPDRLLAKYIFYSEMITELTSSKNKSEQMILFEHLIRKYIQDKSPYITPKGLVFKKQIDTGEVVEIDLEMLSTGEKKLIILIAQAVLSSGSRIMIDEPEVSLSILWQQELLTDLLDQGGIESLVVATHSPYIVRNSDKLEQYITYIEGGV